MCCKKKKEKKFINNNKHFRYMCVVTVGTKWGDFLTPEQYAKFEGALNHTMVGNFVRRLQEHVHTRYVTHREEMSVDQGANHDQALTIHWIQRGGKGNPSLGYVKGNGWVYEDLPKEEILATQGEQQSTRSMIVLGKGPNMQRCGEKMRAGGVDTVRIVSPAGDFQIVGTLPQKVTSEDQNRARNYWKTVGNDMGVCILDLENYKLLEGEGIVVVSKKDVKPWGGKGLVGVDELWREPVMGRLPWRWHVLIGRCKVMMVVANDQLWKFTEDGTRAGLGMFGQNRQRLSMQETTRAQRDREGDLIMKSIPVFVTVKEAIESAQQVTGDGVRWRAIEGDEIMRYNLIGICTTDAVRATMREKVKEGIMMHNMSKRTCMMINKMEDTGVLVINSKDTGEGGD
jgi:hypothetical protein